MNWLAHVIASGDMDDHGSSNTGMYILIAAAVAVAVLVYRNRLRKARARVSVRRVTDAGRVVLDRLPETNSLAVGVRVQHDRMGTQKLSESAL